MKLAIADPPYLGRGRRWYGGGRGSGGGRHVPDFHPEAAKWDDPEAHVDLVAHLVANYDGWAIALSVDSLQTYLEACPTVQVMAWHRRNAPPSGSRIRNTWEPVLVRVPEGRSARAKGLLEMTDVLDEPSPRVGFVGSKPPAWTRWVLAAMGHQPGLDEVTDLFHGSGAVASATDGLLDLWGAEA
jgi:hypothetical protein